MSVHDISLKAYRQPTEEWAARRIRAGRERGEIPTFGSGAWHRLADGDARKAASIVLAAYCWHQGVVNLERDLAEEIEARRVAEEKLEEEEWQRATKRIRRINSTPTHDELERRRKA